LSRRRRRGFKKAQGCHFWQARRGEWNEKKRNEELMVITKTYDLILWSCHHTGGFPRNHRFVLGERIEGRLYDLLEILIQAKYRRERQALLHDANLVLEVLRFQLRSANLRKTCNA
jgi:hypothetical protein